MIGFCFAQVGVCRLESAVWSLECAVWSLECVVCSLEFVDGLAGFEEGGRLLPALLQADWKQLEQGFWPREEVVET